MNVCRFFSPFFSQVVPLDWWPVTRDCVAYGITVAILIIIIHDERVEWYEALVLVLLYLVYIAIMYYDKSIQRRVKGTFRVTLDFADSQTKWQLLCLQAASRT